MGASRRHHGGTKQAAEGLGPAWALKTVLARPQEDDVPGLAAELAFQFFLALFPFFIFLGATGSLMARLLGIDNPADQVVAVLGSNLPESASETVRAVVADTLSKGNSNLLSLTVLGAIWAATAGTDTLMKAMNRAYDVEETRPIGRRRDPNSNGRPERDRKSIGHGLAALVSGGGELSSSCRRRPSAVSWTV